MRRVRNVDKIKGLENQNEYLRQQFRKLREQNATVTTANTQIRQIADAVMVGIVKRYGERREENGNLLGYRLPISHVDVGSTLAKWMIQVEDQREDHDLVITVLPKQEG